MRVHGLSLLSSVEGFELGLYSPPVEISMNLSTFASAAFNPIAVMYAGGGRRDLVNYEWV